MGQRGRPTAQIVLSDDERETLERWARRPKTGQALALRCRIVLAAASGAMNQEIAKKLECNAVTVGKWRTRFAEKRLDGLIDEPRPGQPRKVTDEIVEQVIVATCATRTMASARVMPIRWPMRGSFSNQLPCSRSWTHSPTMMTDGGRRPASRTASGSFESDAETICWVGSVARLTMHAGVSAGFPEAISAAAISASRCSPI